MVVDQDGKGVAGVKIVAQAVHPRQGSNRSGREHGTAVSGTDGRFEVKGLGDLEYKKERKIEEVGNAIQAAHVQQELCNDSLNPNAKKFSDQKKDLLKQRDELELELRDITGRVTKLAVADITEREELDTSMMPPGLANALTTQELADLVDFLAGQTE